MAIIGDEVVAAASSTPAPTAAPAPPPAAAPVPPPPTFTYDKAAGGGVVGQRDDEAPSAAADGVKRFYTPVVLRIAEEHNLDLSKIQGSGAHGRVTRRDVERAIEGRPSTFGRGVGGEGSSPTFAPTPPPVATSAASSPPSPRPPGAPEASRQAREVGLPEVEGALTEDRPLSPMRRAIAEHMTRARAEIPDAWSLTEIDMTTLVRQRQKLQAEWQAREGYELTYLPFFIKAVLAGLRAVPELNASFAGDHTRVHHEYNLGIAVSLDNGLVVPVLRNADQLSVAGIARALRIIVQRARSGKLALDDLQGATFTVNNPGSLGSIMSQPIVPVGQAGIVTMEAIVKRPIVTADDAIAVRSMMNSCLSFDHRVLDGAGALKFLRTIKTQLETVELPLY